MGSQEENYMYQDFYAASWCRGLFDPLREILIVKSRTAGNENGMLVPHMGKNAGFQ